MPVVGCRRSVKLHVFPYRDHRILLRSGSIARLTAEHGSFSRICQMAPIYTLSYTRFIGLTRVYLSEMTSSLKRDTALGGNETVKVDNGVDKK